VKTLVIVLRTEPLNEKEEVLLAKMFPGKTLDITHMRPPASQQEWKELCESTGIPEDVKVIYADPYPLYLPSLRAGYEHFTLHHDDGWKLVHPPQLARMTDKK
jgi:hypothetical protein